MATQAERVAAAHERDSLRYRRYRQARAEAGYDGEWGALVSSLNRLFATGDGQQRTLREFEVGA